MKARNVASDLTDDEVKFDLIAGTFSRLHRATFLAQQAVDRISRDNAANAEAELNNARQFLADAARLVRALREMGR